VAEESHKNVTCFSALIPFWILPPERLILPWQRLQLNPEKIVGIDLSEGMLKVGRQKIEKKRFVEPD
jgi:hypothetical protein